MARVISVVAEPYQMIAKVKGVVLDIDLNSSFMVNLPVPLFEKAVSNVLFNAVAYTAKGRNVLVYTVLSPANFWMYFRKYGKGKQRLGRTTQ